MEKEIMDLSYQEKSILGSLLAFVVVFGYYFAAVCETLAGVKPRLGWLAGSC